jgi:hypothetical protein
LGRAVDFKVAAIYVDGIALINGGGSSVPSSPDYNPNYGTIKFDEQLARAGQHIVFTCSTSLGDGPHNIAIATQRGSNFKDQFNLP